jgi:hypothetical protein
LSAALAFVLFMGSRTIMRDISKRQEAALAARA